MKDFNEEDYLMLSGVQHFAFCRRQWALIHIENQWMDNYRTMDGILMHENAHDSTFSEKRNNVLIKRELRVYSSYLGVSGECDIVEFHKNNTKGIELYGEEGRWLPIPIEYKRGKPKITDVDKLQLCCEAMCLEEMLCCEIERGYMFYGETHRREEVVFSDDLRKKVEAYLKEMHDLYLKKYTPKVKQHKGCKNCSLKECCLSKLTKLKSATTYVKEMIEYEKNA